MQLWQRAVLCGLTLMVVSCASVNKQIDDHEWMRKTRDVTVQTASVVSDSASKTAKRMQDYLARKDLLKTFTDASEHSENAVLDVLHKAGVGSNQSAAKPAKPGPKAPTKGPGKTPANSPATQLPSTVPTKYAGALRWPVDAGIISSEFGARHGKPHKGIDIAGDVGEPVFAIADGQVIYASDGMSGYGNVVIVRHDQNLTSLYAHNSALKVHRGDQVKQGTLISLLGNTGRSTGPHVHFEIRDGDTPLNPRIRLPKSQLASSGYFFDADDDEPQHVANLMSDYDMQVKIMEAVF